MIGFAKLDFNAAARSAHALAVGFGAAAAVMLGCAPAVATVPTVPFCSMPWANCRTCADVGCQDAVEQWWCCQEGGECAPVDFAINCPPGTEWIAYCEYGQSTPASGPDGEGWECLE